MDKPKLTGQRLTALFFVGNLFFNFPLLVLFNRPSMIFGIPLLYFYVFAAWVLFITLLAIVVEKG